MNPGPDQIVACPHCRELGKYRTTYSGNTFGARVWTDAKQIAPMFPRPPAVVICRHCARFYWLADAGTIGPPFGADADELGWPARAAVDYVVEPTEAEYRAAIEGGFARGRRRETTLRLLAWQRANDPYRESSCEEIDAARVATPAYRSNLKRLAALFGEADDVARFRKAAALRELGRFKVAAEILGGITSAGIAAIVGQLRSLCDHGDDRFRELYPDA